MKIFVKIKPNSRREDIKQMNDNHYLVRVKDPPHDNKANEAMIRAMGKHLDVSPSDIKLIRGYSSSHKVIEIGGRLDIKKLRSSA